MSNTLGPLRTFLSKHRADGVFHTHVSMATPKEKYNLNRNSLTEFWRLYGTAIADEANVVCIAEKPHEYLPVLVDVDLKVKDAGEIEFGDHVYTEVHLQTVIQVYQSILRRIVSKCTDENLLCVVMEKPIYYIKVDNSETGSLTYAKNGFHLHFPNLFLSKADQEVQLIPRAQEELKKLDIFSDLKIADSGSVIDKNCCTVPWLLYGSRKGPGMDPYTVSYVVDSCGHKLDIETALAGYKLYDVNEQRISISGRVREFLPQILSIIPYNRSMQEIKADIVPLAKEKVYKQNRANIKKTTSVDVDEALRVSAELLPMLADRRAEDRHEWMTIGWILFNIGDGSEEALEQWLQFSSRCAEKYSEVDCIYEWRKMVKKDLTLGSLRYYASIDSPEEYKKYKKSVAEKSVIGSLKGGTHNDIAKVLYTMCSEEYVCASITNKMWFRYNDHHWEEIEEGNDLRKKISEDVYEVFAEEVKRLYDKVAKVPENDAGMVLMLNNKIKQIQKIMVNCKSASFKNNVMREAMEVFYDRRFKEKLDKNPYTIGFQNGVYDLKANYFRSGRPEDFISKRLPIEYREFDETGDAIQEIVDFLQKIFPDESVRRYFLDMYSDIFVGGNTYKKVFFWTGEGDNGKSVLKQLFETMLGELSVKVSTQYFTGKKVAAGSANPELVRMAPPVRDVTMEEADPSEQINTGEVKKLSGDDSWWGRDLYEKGKSVKEIVGMFMLTWICNNLPRIRNPDKATWNRIRVIPFEMVFKRNPAECPDTLKEQIEQRSCPMDPTIKERIRSADMAEAFAWYLLQWRQHATLFEPEKVKNVTDAYRLDNDIYRQFVEECVVEDAEKSVTVSDMYSHFKGWYREGFPHNAVPIKQEVKDHLDKFWKKSVRNSWYGCRIRSLQDELHNGEAMCLDTTDMLDYDTATRVASSADSSVASMSPL